VSTVTPLRRKPAYTPMGPPVQCMTPGHGDITRYPARSYPGGRLCEDCLPRTAGDNRNDEGDSR
jgi:hypothetical protein